MPAKSDHLAATRATEIFVAGGGPAGLACAIALASKGHRVFVADGMKPPIDKACGEGLMPDTIAALRQLGVDFHNNPTETAVIATPIRGIRFIDTSNANVAQASFPPHSGDGRGIQRKTLHQILIDRAVDLSVTLLWETVVLGLGGQGSDGTTVETNRGRFTARFVIGADGQRSRIRSAAGLERARTTAQRVALRQHFAIVPWTDLVEVYWSGHGQAYVTPVSDTEVCVAFVNNTRFTGGVPQALGHFPQLSTRLAQAAPTDTPRGAITCSRKLHRVTRGNVALLGDASGSVDAVTGEGLSLAFRQALSLAEAIHRGDLASYQRSHRRIGRMPRLNARIMLLLDRSPSLRSCAIAFLARLPRLFAMLLEIHIRHPDLWAPDRKAVVAAPHTAIHYDSVPTAVPRNAVP